MKRLLLYAIPLAIIGLGAAYFMYNKPFKNMHNAKAEFEVTATDLFEAFDTDESAANAQYLDKVIAVSGVVKEISGNAEGKKEVLLDTGNPLSSIACSMDHLSKHEGLSSVQKGDRITLKGICTGMLMDVVVDRAILVE